MQGMSVFSNLEQQHSSSGNVQLGIFPSPIFRLYKVFFSDEESEAVSSKKTVPSKTR